MMMMMMCVLQGLLEKARVKGQHDNTFTESLLQKLFCNIENILDFHHELVAELKSCLKSGVSYGSQIATVYLKFVSKYFTYFLHTIHLSVCQLLLHQQLHTHTHTHSLSLPLRKKNSLSTKSMVKGMRQLKNYYMNCKIMRAFRLSFL